MRILRTATVLTVMAIGAGPVRGQGDGLIVGWGRMVVSVDLSQDFVAVAAGSYHSLGIKGLVEEMNLINDASRKTHGGVAGYDIELFPNPVGAAGIGVEYRGTGVVERLMLDFDGQFEGRRTK